MRNLLRLGGLLLAAHLLSAQGNPTNASNPPDCYAGTQTPITATGTSGYFNNELVGCRYWYLFYTTTSGTASLSIELDVAPLGTTARSMGTFAAAVGGSTNPSTTVANGFVYAVSGAPWIAVKVGTLDAGTVNWTLSGWRFPPAAFASASGAPTLVPMADTTASVSVTAASTVKIVTGVASKTVYVTGGFLSMSTAGTYQVISGTGATCGTGSTNITPAMNLSAAGTEFGSGYGMVLKTAAAGDSLCVAATTGTALGWWAFTIY